MDKLQEKPVEERKKILFRSTLLLGFFIGSFGLWNISNNLVALNTNTAKVFAVEEKAEAPSPFTTLKENIASAWTSVQDNLKELNDKLGTEGGGLEESQNTLNQDSGVQSGEVIKMYDQEDQLNSYEE